MDIVSPWDHRAYEKEGEKIEKYQDLKREIERQWRIRHLKVVPQGGSPLYGLYRYERPQRVGFLSRFGHK